ncbi:MAG: C39 family peptidase [Bacteroidales bacterium]|nr:C39 family peptidase [Bacteroidales bacterium]
MKKIISAFALVLLFISVKGQQPTYAGIRSDVLNYYAAQYGDTYQKNSQWCWAASIKMVLNYYGVSISQEQIVSRTYGTDNFGSLPDWPGSMQAVHANLNNWGIDNFGQKYSVSASFGMGAPTPAYLINELSNGHPVIIGYNTGNGGHAVVVTAVSYINTYNGPMIQTIVVRDPWPSAENLASNGRVEYPGSYLASKIQAYWYIRVYR